MVAVLSKLSLVRLPQSLRRNLVVAAYCPRASGACEKKEGWRDGVHNFGLTVMAALKLGEEEVEEEYLFANDRRLVLRAPLGPDFCTARSSLGGEQRECETGGKEGYVCGKR